MITPSRGKEKPKYLINIYAPILLFFIIRFVEVLDPVHDRVVKPLGNVNVA